MQTIAHEFETTRKGVLAMADRQPMFERGGRGLNRYAHRRQIRAAQRRMLGLALLLAVAALLLLPSSDASAQTPSTLDTLRIEPVSPVAPGDTFFVEYYIHNVDTLGAISFRVEFDETLIEPLTDTVNGSITTEAAEQPRGKFTLADTYGGSLPDPGVMTWAFIDFDLNPADYWTPYAGTMIRQRWLVKSAATSQTTSIQFVNDPAFPNSNNVFGDISGLRLIRPTLIGRTITISSETAGAPLIENCPSPFTVAQGNLAQFSITATDPDGDDLQLQATNLPAGATFSPANPATGNTSVTGTFSWIPSTSQSGDFTVSFRATDVPGGNSSPFCNVTITVSEDVTGNPPNVTCQASTINVDQGQLVEFTINATDADGDVMTFTAMNLPTGATLSPALPITSTGPLNTTFRWTPSFSQSGAFTVTFQAVDDDNNTDACNTSIFVNEVQKDQLFTTSSPGQKPQGGVPGTPNVVVPIDFVTVNESYGVQFDFVYDPTIFTPTQLQVTDRLAGFQIYDDMGETPGRIRIVAFDLSGDPIPMGSSSVLFNIVGNMVPGTTPGEYPVYFENAWESISPDPNEPSVSLATSDGVIMVDYLGDANLDTRIDIGDIVAIVGNILGNYSFTLRQFVAGDVVVDATLDVFDLQGIINLIFGDPISSTPNAPSNDEPARVEFVYQPSDGLYGAYHLITDAPVDVAGAQMTLLYDSKAVTLGAPEPLAAAKGMDVTYRDHRKGALLALMIDPTNQARIPVGRNEVMRIPVLQSANEQPVVRLHELKLAASDAGKIEVESANAVPRSFALHQNYPNPFNPSTTIAFSIYGGDSFDPVDVTLDIYNVLGQRVTTLVQDQLEPGRYEFQWNGTDRSGRTVASGLYFYRLKAGGQDETKKMVLLK
ncbi:MAG: hypothetical protein Kow0074_00010 [Candidatus Zixiibacteriota bacterium]